MFFFVLLQIILSLRFGKIVVILIVDRNRNNNVLVSIIIFEKRFKMMQIFKTDRRFKSIFFDTFVVNLIKNIRICIY